MPFSGGTYSFPSLPGSFNPAVVGSNATAADWNTLAADLTTNGLSMCITRNGQSTITANIPMSTFRFTGLGAGTAAGQSVRFEQVFPAGTSLLATLQRSYLAGLAMSNSSGSPNTQIDIAAGVCMDSTNVQMMVIAAGTINCATTGANGLDAGSLANNTWYFAFGIAKTDGTTAYLASTSASSPTLPSGYTLLRRLGCFKTNGSAQIIAFVQDGDVFQWKTPVQDVATTNPGTSAVTATLASVPSSVRVQAWIQGFYGNSDVTEGNAIFTDLSCNDVAPTASTFADTGVANVGNLVDVTVKYVFTNTSQQIRYRVSYSSGNVAVRINTLGWVDRRGRDS